MYYKVSSAFSPPFPLYRTFCATESFPGCERFFMEPLMEIKNLYYYFRVYIHLKIRLQFK